MSTTDLLATFDALAGRRPRLLVVGDLILDRYTWGGAERVSQEAPVILLRVDRREQRLGGAANVCQMLAGLEADAAAAGVVGRDAAGDCLRGLLTDRGVDTSLVLEDVSRPTTEKERFIGRAANRHGHQILRVDTELREPLAGEIEAELVERITASIAEYDAVLVSDYDKGVCTAGLLRQVIDAARRAGVPVVVDPVRLDENQRDGYRRYHGATTMTPNRLEAERAAGLKIGGTDDAFAAGRVLCRQAGLDYAIVTLDRDGMVLVDHEKRGRARAPRHFPTRPREVYDITGAGDMVLATIGLCLAAGVSPEDAVRLGNVTGGLEVEKEGVVVLSREEVRRDLLAHRPVSECKLLDEHSLLDALAAERRQGRSIVFTNGCFDLLHVGHLKLLEEAAAEGDVLVAAVNSDSSVRRLKGPGRPVISERDRGRLLASLAVVDYVVVFDDDSPLALLEQIRPDVLVKGGTYLPEQVVGHELVAQYGGRVHVTGVLAGVSTTSMLASLAGRPALAGPHFHKSPRATHDERNRRPA